MSTKRIAAAFLLLALALTAFTGCGKEAIKGTEKNADSSSAVQDEDSGPVIVDEPDFMGFLTGTSSTDFYNMSVEEFEQATGGQFNEENAVEYHDWDGIRADYYLGKTDTILCGRVNIGKECDVYCTVSFKKNKLKTMSIEAEGFTKEETDKICEDFLKAFEGKLPEQYEAYPPLEHGDIYEVGYNHGYDDFIISLRRDRNMADVYRILFTLENYSERYGM